MLAARPLQWAHGGCEVLREELEISRPCGQDFTGLGDAIVQSAPDGMVLVDVSGTIHLVNPALLELTGFSADELVGKPLSFLLPPSIRSEHDDWVRTYFMQPHRRAMGSCPVHTGAQPTGAANAESTFRRFEIAHKSGKLLCVDVALSPCQLRARPYVVAFVRDISHIRRMETELALQATHDALTGLPNRRKLHDELQRLLALAQRHQRPLALMLMDLNGFKEINDAYGHAMGDRVLQAVAHRLQGALRSSDMLARLGGDEFVVLVSEMGHAQDYVAIGNKLLCTLAQPLEMEGVEFSLSSAIGVSVYPLHGADAQSLVRFADMAMYSAKGRGGNCVLTYDDEMGAQMHAKVQILERLRQALSQDLLELHYQPQVDARSGKTIGVEALLRWNDPVLGQVPPDKAIAVAESSDLIHRLGQWIIDTACRQSAQWERQGLAVRVAINLSARQFRRPDLVEQLRAAAQRHGASLARLEVEITESQAMENLAHTSDLLDQLHRSGVGVALDDFGEGYSNWVQLQRMSINRLKLSRNFLRNIDTSDSDRRLVSAILAMARILNLVVVAEGVETSAQRDFLVAESCDVLQGWYFARAMPAPELQARWLRADALAACT